MKVEASYGINGRSADGPDNYWHSDLVRLRRTEKETTTATGRHFNVLSTAVRAKWHGASVTELEIAYLVVVIGRTIYL